MKKLFVFLIFLLPWYLGSILFPVDLSYYSSLTVPIRLPSLFFIIVWNIIYLLMALVSTKIYFTFGKQEAKEYFTGLLFNYILNTLFTYFLFTLKSPFLGFTDSIILFISTLICYYQVKELNKQFSIYFIPYLLLSLGATAYLLITIFLNL